MKIIIEGPDNIGKDTQINNIIKTFKNTFIHLHYYGCPIKDKNEAINWGTDLYNDMFSLIKTFDNIICNRSHIGEAVYSPLYRGYSGDYVFNLEKEHEDVLEDICLIIFIDEPQALIDRDDGLSHSTSIDQKTKEIKLFTEAYQKSNIKNKIIININKMTIEDVKREVIDFLTSNKHK